MGTLVALILIWAALFLFLEIDALEVLKLTSIFCTEVENLYY